jgi:hypothetical protein
MSWWRNRLVPTRYRYAIGPRAQAGPLLGHYASHSSVAESPRAAEATVCDEAMLAAFATDPGPPSELIRLSEHRSYVSRHRAILARPEPVPSQCTCRSTRSSGDDPGGTAPRAATLSWGSWLVLRAPQRRLEHSAQQPSAVARREVPLVLTRRRWSKFLHFSAFSNTWRPTPAGSMRPSPTQRGCRPPCWRPGSPAAGWQARSPRERCTAMSGPV